MTGATRRALFAGIAALSVAAPAVGAVAADPMAAWREGYGVWIEDPRIWPLVVEAHALGLRPDQVTGFYFKGPCGPCLSFVNDKGAAVRVYQDHVLWLHERAGDPLDFDARAELLLGEFR
jgi:hypothetical protein